MPPYCFPDLFIHVVCCDVRLVEQDKKGRSDRLTAADVHTRVDRVLAKITKSDNANIPPRLDMHSCSHPPISCRHGPARHPVMIALLRM